MHAANLCLSHTCTDCQADSHGPKNDSQCVCMCACMPRMYAYVCMCACACICMYVHDNAYMITLYILFKIYAVWYRYYIMHTNNNHTRLHQVSLYACDMCIYNIVYNTYAPINSIYIYIYIIYMYIR